MDQNQNLIRTLAGADLGGGCRGAHPPPPEMTCGFLIQLVFCQKKTMCFIGVEVEQETSAPPPGSAPVLRSALVCLRGSRTRRVASDIKNVDIDVEVVEGAIQSD